MPANHALCIEMSSKLNKTTYEQLIQEDIRFLLSHCPDTLERHHIEQVLKHNVALYYFSNLSAEVLEWLDGLERNALTVPNPDLAARCVQARTFIMSLLAQTT